MWLLFPCTCKEPYQNGCRRRQLWELVRRGKDGQSFEFPGVRREGCGNTGKDRTFRRCYDRWMYYLRTEDGTWCYWCTFYDGKYGPCGRWENYTCHGGCNGKETSGHPVLLFRWSTYAGRNRFPDADGKNFRSSQASFGCRSALCAGTYGPYDRWSYRQLCNAWWYYTCRAESLDRFCRSACHRADNWPEAAGRIPAGRISVRAWLCRCNRRAWWFKDDFIPYFENAWAENRLCKLWSIAWRWQLWADRTDERAQCQGKTYECMG